MSGQPRKNASDDTKFRNAYLANLNARSKLDAFELQSSRNLERTGQPTAEMTDTRNLTEIFADTEQLKIAVRSGLLQITDGANAQMIVNNLAPEQLQLVAGRIDTIVKDIKPAYKLGIPAEIFIQYIDRLERDLTVNQGVADGLQQVSGRELLLTLRDIKQSLVDRDDLAGALAELKKLNIPNLDKYFQDLMDNIPTYAVLEEAMRQGKEEIITELMEELPSKGELRRAVEAILQTQTSPKAFAQAIDDLRDLIAMNQEQLDLLNDLQAGGGGRATTAFTFKTPEQISSMKLVAFQPYATKILEAYPQLEGILSEAFVIKDGEISSKKPAFSKLADMRGWFQANNERLEQMVQGVPVASPVKGTPVAQPVTGKGMKGCGVARQRPPRSKPTIAFDLGVKEDEKYLPIGRYLISKRQLDKDIVAIKTKTGASLNGMPSQRVSSHFAKAMRNIIGGSAPSYDEITGMSDEERHYLHKIANTTRIADRLKIPAPDKTKDEQDINRFNVLRGQVSAGQDSREAIKELKLLIIKLKNKELLPSRQAKDILYELTELGY